jgi:hypothetical protein
MPILVTCPKCSTKLNAPDTAAGRQVKCPKCTSALTVPAAKAAGGAAKSAAPASKPAPPASKPAASKSPASKPPAPAAAKAPAARGGTAASSESAAVKPPAPPAPPARASKPAAPAKPRKRDEDDDDGDDGESNWESSELLTYNEWTVKIQGLITLNIRNRHYNIYKPNTKDPIGVVDETASGLLLALRMMKFGKMLPTTVEVREEKDGPLILAIRRGLIFFPLPVTIDIFDDRRKKLGYFKTKLFSLLGGFWLYDAEGNEVAEVKGKIGIPPRYLFLSKDGRELGSITTDALAKTTGPNAKRFAVEFGRPGMRLKVTEDMTDEPKVKVLMLATVLAMEFTGIGDRFLIK